jgi:hypothetical protein
MYTSRTGGRELGLIGASSAGELQVASNTRDINIIYHVVNLLFTYKRVGLDHGVMTGIDAMISLSSSTLSRNRAYLEPMDSSVSEMTSATVPYIVLDLILNYWPVKITHIGYQESINMSRVERVDRTLLRLPSSPNRFYLGRAHD